MKTGLYAIILLSNFQNYTYKPTIGIYFSIFNRCLVAYYYYNQNTVPDEEKLTFKNKLNTGETRQLQSMNH